MSYREIFEEIRSSDTFKLNKITLNFANALWNIMQQKNIKSSELAKMLGTSPAYITKVLRGDANYTVETLYKLTKAVDCKIEINIVDEESNQNTEWETNSNYSLVTLANYKSSELINPANKEWTSPVDKDNTRLRVVAA